MNNQISHKIKLDSHEYDTIDLLRFLFSFLVIAIHYPPFSSINIYLNYGVTQYLARIAVPFYFISTGYFIAQKAKICTVEYKQDVLVKYVKQYIKLYLIWTIIYLPWIIKDEIISNSHGPLIGVILWIVHFIFSGSYWHLWYINALIWSVVILIILLKLKFSITKICVISFILYIVGLLGESYFGILRLLQNNDLIWTFLKSVKLIIGTTRNGLFFGLLFVGLGFLIGAGKVKIFKPIFNVWGFIVSLLILLIESYFLIKIDFARANDMYLLLIPTTYFLFILTLSIHINLGKYNKFFRKIYSYIYLIHPMVINIFIAILSWNGVMEFNSFLSYCIITIMTVVLSICTIFIKRKLIRNNR